jgi:hypothetical protein
MTSALHAPCKEKMMRYLRMLVPAAVATAVATMGFGVGTVSATKLCENNQTTSCSSSVASGAGVEFSAEETTKMVGPFSLLVQTCTQSVVAGPTTNAGGGSGVAVTEAVNVLTFASCTRPLTVSKNGTLSIQQISGTDNGTVTSTGMTFTVHEVPGFGSCSYETNQTDIGTGTGSLTSPTLDVSASLKSETPGCPEVSWTGRYKHTGTTPHIVSAG